ncbi:MAG: hypothetical protein ACAH80_04475 [Alphaproteobacteria bacterium]
MWLRKKKTVEIPEPDEEPEPAMPERPETPLEKWNKRLAAYQQLAAGVSVDDKGKPVVPEDARKAFTDLGALDKDQADFKVFIGAQLALDKALLLCEAGALHWWIVKTGRAYAGDIEGLQKVHDRIEALKLQQPSANSMMTWVCYPHAVVEGYSNKLTNTLLDTVFAMGADVNHDKGSWLEKAMRSLNATGVGCFVAHGADATTVARVYLDLQQNNSSQAKVVEEALRGMTLDGRVDDQTLLRATFSPDGATLKTYFNFAQRRVQEVTVQPLAKDVAVAMTSASFKDYDSGAVDAAQKALEKLGGKPKPYRHAGNFGMARAL